MLQYLARHPDGMPAQQLLRPPPTRSVFKTRTGKFWRQAACSPSPRTTSAFAAQTLGFAKSVGGVVLIDGVWQR